MNYFVILNYLLVHIILAYAFDTGDVREGEALSLICPIDQVIRVDTSFYGNRESNCSSNSSETILKLLANW